MKRILKNSLSAYIIAFLPIVFQGNFLSAAASSSQDRFEIMQNSQNRYEILPYVHDADTVKDICFKAKELCSHAGEYHIYIDRSIDSYSARIDVVKLQGSVSSPGVSCGNPNFCNPLQRDILYEDDLVRVLKSKTPIEELSEFDAAWKNTFKGEAPLYETELLITSKEHIVNTHALDITNGKHHALLNRMARVAEHIAQFLEETDASYTLTIKNGSMHDPFHLHMNFCSSSHLNERGLIKSRLNMPFDAELDTHDEFSEGELAHDYDLDVIVDNRTHVEQPHITQTPSRWSWKAIALVAGCAVAVAAAVTYSIWSWRTKAENLIEK